MFGAIWLVILWCFHCSVSLREDAKIDYIALSGWRVNSSKSANCDLKFLTLSVFLGRPNLFENSLYFSSKVLEKFWRIFFNASFFAVIFHQYFVDNLEKCKFCAGVSVPTEIVKIQCSINCYPAIIRSSKCKCIGTKLAYWAFFHGCCELTIWSSLTKHLQRQQKILCKFWTIKTHTSSRLSSPNFLAALRIA